MFRSLLLLTLAAAPLVAGSADVYKYTDAKGNVQYTDKPPSLPAERINIQSQRSMPAPQPTQQTAATTPSQPANKTPVPQNTTTTTADDKGDACAKARERYDRYMNSQKLYEQAENGERRYLSDSELDAARASAKASMDVLCK